MANITGTGATDFVFVGSASGGVNPTTGFTDVKDVANLFGGDDKARAGGGNDTVFGGFGDDTLYGEAGNDLLYGDSGHDILFGGDDDTRDRLFGGDGCDLIFGGGGNDLARGGEQGDFIDGGNGDDVLRGDDGTDVLFGGNGNDTLIGGSNFNTNKNPFPFCADGADVLGGGSCLTEDQAERIVFGKNAFFTKFELLDGGNGNDIIRGGAGEDFIIGGRGNDFLQGGGGDDVFYWCETSAQTDTIIDFRIGRDQIDLTAVKFGNGTDLGSVNITPGPADPQGSYTVTFGAVKILVVVTNPTAGHLTVSTNPFDLGNSAVDIVV